MWYFNKIIKYENYFDFMYLAIFIFKNITTAVFELEEMCRMLLRFKNYDHYANYIIVCTVVFIELYVLFHSCIIVMTLLLNAEISIIHV